MAGSPVLLKAIQNLGSKHAHVRNRAVGEVAAALKERGAGHAEDLRVAVRCLADHVADPDEKTAVAAARLLVSLGPDAVPTFPELAQACLDKRSNVSLEAATSMAKLLKASTAARKKALDVLPVLVNDLPKVHPEAVGQVAAVIRLLEDDAEPAIEQLVEKYLMPQPTGSWEKLREWLTGRYQKRKKICFELLGRIGPRAAPALPALKGFLTSPDPWLQKQARSCIIRIRRA